MPRESGSTEPSQSQAEEVPLILGQVNFFLEFDVCLFRAQSRFDVSPKTRPSS